MTLRLRLRLLRFLGCPSVECIAFTERVARMKTRDEWADEGVTFNGGVPDNLILDARAAIAQAKQPR